MGWIILLVCGGFIIVDLMLNAEESTPIPPQRNGDADHFITYHNRMVGMCKGKELEIEKCQMN